MCGGVYRAVAPSRKDAALSSVFFCRSMRLPLLKAQQANPQKSGATPQKRMYADALCATYIHGFAVLSSVLSLDATPTVFPQRSGKPLTVCRRVLGGEQVSPLFSSVSSSPNLQCVGLQQDDTPKIHFSLGAKLVQTERAVWSALCHALICQKKKLPQVPSSSQYFYPCPACTLME